MDGGAEVMTDYQMRAILNMIMNIVNEGKNKKDILKKLMAIHNGKIELENFEAEDFEE